MQKVLVIIGPTGVGKTALSIQIAQHYQCPIISADSRQIYKEIPIGTAAPTEQEQQSVKHYFIGNKSITEHYNAGQYERDCLQLLEQLNREKNPIAKGDGDLGYASLSLFDVHPDLFLCV